MKPAVPQFVSRIGRLFCSAPSLRSRRAKSVWSMSPTETAEVLESRQLLTPGLVNAARLGENGAENGSGAVDLQGNQFVAGNSTGSFDADPGPGVTVLTNSGSWDAFVTKFSPDGTLTWARRIGGASADLAADIEVDGSGNSYVLGTFDGIVDFDPEAGISNLDSANGSNFLFKLNSAGSLVWAKQFGQGATVEPITLTIDAMGSIVMAGKFLGFGDFDPGINIDGLNGPGAVSDRSAFLVKWSSNGDFVWAKGFGGASATVMPTSIATAADGSIVVGGYFEGVGSVDFDPSTVIQRLKTSQGPTDAFVSKFHSSGTLLWNHCLGAGGFEAINDVAVDSSGNVTVAGGFTSTTDFDPGSATRTLAPISNNDGFVLQFTAAGGFRWVTQLGGMNASYVSSLIIDSSDQIIIAGNGFDAQILGPGRSLDLDGYYIAKLDRNGDPLWATRIGAWIKHLSLAPRNNIVGTGNIFGVPVDIDPDFGETILQPIALGDVVLAQFTQELRVTASSVGQDSFLLRQRGEFLEVADKNTGVVVASGPLSEILGVEITGQANEKDSLLVDFGGGAFALPQGIRFNANTGTDDLSVIGVGSESVVYKSGSFSGLTELFINGGVIQATGIESTDVSSMAAVRIETQGMADSVTVNPFQVIGTTLKTTIGGSSSGQTIVPLSFQAVDRVTVDTGAKDSVPAQSIDSVTISAGALEAPELLDFIVTTGIANDIITITGPDFAAPGESGILQVLGGTGVDRVNVTGDVNWTLSQTQVSNSLGSRLLLGSVETVGITGGAAANFIDASSFTGTAILDAGAGDDVVRGGSGNDLLFGGTGNDQIYGNVGNDIMYGQDGHDSMWGGDGNDVMYGNALNDRIYGGAGNDWIDASTGNDIVLGDDGNDTILGGDGNDFLRGGDGDDSLNGGGGNDVLLGEDGEDILLGGTGNDRLNGGAGDDTLTGEAGIDVYIFDGTSAADEMRLTRNSATTATYVRRPRGLLSILEQDSITNDATDEFSLNALGGDDLIAIDLTFALLGSVDGGDGIDTCTSPAAWIKVSC